MTRSERETIPTDELSLLAMALSQIFVQRWDIYARQLQDGRYLCIHGPLTNAHLNSHLRGEITLGTYVLNRQSEAQFIVFDSDENQGLNDMMTLAHALADENVPSYLETSRRGGHLWLFFSNPVEGYLAREFGHGILAFYKLEGIELFPKQDHLRAGPGSLIRMPFGVHQLTGRRYGFITIYGDQIAPSIHEQLNILSSPQTVPRAAIEAYRSYVPEYILPTDTALLERASDTVSDKIKGAITVLDFVNQFVDLKPTGSSAIGRCPFHDDHNPSFSVNAEGNYWHCFAGCGGGSVIDFWMKWRKCDFTTAVTELARIIL